MVSSLYAAASALFAYGQTIQVTAHNVANVNTEGFKKSRAVLEEGSPAGVTISIQQIDSSGPTPGGGGSSGNSQSANVDLAEEWIHLKTAEYGFRANLKMIQVEEERIGSLLDRIE